MLKKIIAVLLFLSLISIDFSEIHAKTLEETDVAVTLYNQGFAIVKEKLNIQLSKGLNEFIMSDVPSAIVPSSVKLYSELAPKAVTVIEQDYIFDLVDSYKLLNKYLDKNIGVQLKDKYFSGRLLGAGGGYVLKTENEIVSIIPDKVEHIIFPELPDGLIAKPSLKWKIHSTLEGIQPCVVLYESKNMSWNAEYVAVLKDDDKKLDLKCWVNLNNNTSRAFKNTKLKLMAGDINRVSARRPVTRNMMYAKSMAVEDYAAPEFDSQSFFEFYLYTLNMPVDISANSEKQASLFETADVPVDKRYLYNANIDQTKINVNVVFANSKKNNVGMAMPAGKIRVNKMDNNDKSLEFIGEDRIDHTPENDTVTLKLGKAFDMKATRILKNSRRYSDKRWEETYEITFLNSKKEAVIIDVVENLASHTNWRIFDNNYSFTKLSASQIQFNIKIPADSRETLRYTIEYNNN